MNRPYRVEYKEHSADQVRAVVVHADNVRDAYLKAYFDVLKGKAYSAWVESVLYNNNNIHYFNNFEGKPY